MNWVVVGQGAMGLLWYHHLNQAKKTCGESDIYELSLLASKQQDLKQTHYQFTSLDKQVSHGVVNYAKTKQLQAADAVFLCLKSYQINNVINQIARHSIW